MRDALAAPSCIVHICIDGTGLFIGLQPRVTWHVGHGPGDLQKKMTREDFSFPAILSMAPYHMLVDWDKTSRRWVDAEAVLDLTQRTRIALDAA